MASNPSSRASPVIFANRHPCPPAPVLPHLHNEEIDSAIPPVEVTKVCLRLRHLVQECVPCEMEESRITAPHSRIITPHVIRAAKEAGGQEHKGCVVRYGCLYAAQHWIDGILTGPRSMLCSSINAGSSTKPMPSFGMLACISSELKLAASSPKPCTWSKQMPH